MVGRLGGIFGTGVRGSVGVVQVDKKSGGCEGVEGESGWVCGWVDGVGVMEEAEYRK